MNIKRAMNRRLRGHARDTDVNLTAVMNVFLILIPFLLLTATFVRISVLELSLPNLEKPAQQTATVQSQSAILNILLIRENEIVLKSPNLEFASIGRQATTFEWQLLKVQLKKVKEKYPESQDIIISPENSIKYETIIAIMDCCRETGFPNISISG